MERNWVRVIDSIIVAKYVDCTLNYVEFSDLVPISPSSGDWSDRFEFNNGYFVLLGVF